jgi:hypothetical protein
MELEIAAVAGVNLTSEVVRVVAIADEVGVYISSVEPVTPTAAPYYGYHTRLTAVKVGTYATLDPNQILLPQPLPATAEWDLVLTSSGNGTVATAQFGGGWNTLIVDGLSSGKRVPGYVYQVEDTNDPRFLQNTGSGASQQAYVSAILSGFQLGVIGLQTQDGQQVPGVTGIVGSSSEPVSTGRIFGDLTNGLPGSLGVSYINRKSVGPLAPSGAFCGGLFFATFDVQGNKLSTPVPLLPGIDFATFDLAVLEDYLCLLATTGSGAPLLAMFDTTGKPLGTSNMPVGTWSNGDHWVASPSIVATQRGFAFTFVDMDGQTPATLYFGTLTSPTN